MVPCGFPSICIPAPFRRTFRKAWHILNCLESVGGDLNAYTNKEPNKCYYNRLSKKSNPFFEIFLKS